MRAFEPMMQIGFTGRAARERMALRAMAMTD
jgi:hypothetical protein